MLTGRKRGGTPCIPDHYIPKYRKEFGRPCPHVELLTVNEDASQLVVLALNEHTQPLLPAYLSTMDPTVMSEAMSRVIPVLSSKELGDAIEESGKKAAARKAQTEAARRKASSVRRVRKG